MHIYMRICTSAISHQPVISNRQSASHRPSALTLALTLTFTLTLTPNPNPNSYPVLALPRQIVQQLGNVDGKKSKKGNRKGRRLYADEYSEVSWESSDGWIGYSSRTEASTPAVTVL